jgi:FMN-dependent oxidoreductase (nitrilotriacetate monooxygenase family)
VEYYVQIARLLEQGRFDLLFFADRLAIADRYGGDKTVGLRYGDQDATRLDPLPILGALAATTRHIGLGATRSTTYEHPYPLAREFCTLDHLSQGRAAWNVVTSMNDGEALNFGLDTHLSHDERYDRADEFMELMGKLWESWEPDALLLDRAQGLYADPDKVHYVQHAGHYFTARGPLNIPQSPQGRPVIIQAVASARGQTFAAKWAEVIFQIAPTRGHMRRATASMREAVAQLGRRPEDCKVLTAIIPFIGRTEQEARDTRDQINALVNPLAGLSTLSAHANMDLSTVALDVRVEELRSSGTQSLIALAAQQAKAQGLTMRELGQRYGESVLVPQLCGTATQIAEQLAEIFTSGDADGFVISPALLPDSFVAFVESVVPELQRIGVFRVEYAAPTLRGNLHSA